MAELTLPDGTTITVSDTPTEQERALIRKMLPSISGQLPKRTPMEAIKHYGPEAAKVAGSSIYNGLVALPRLAGLASQGVEALTPWQEPPGIGKVLGPLDEKVRTALQPESEGGQYAARVGESVVAGVAGPGGLANPVKSAAIGGGAGVGAEASADAFGDNTLTRVMGGLAGGGLTGIGTSAFTNRGSLARETLADVRPRDLETARQRMMAAELEGNALNLSQAMPRASNIDSLVNSLAQSPSGRRTTEMLRNQPKTVAFEAENAVANLPGRIVPQQTAANSAQDAMTRVIADGMQEAGAAWRRFAPEGAEFTQSGVARLDNELAKMANLYPNQEAAAMIDTVRRNLLRPKAPETDTGPQILTMFGQPIRTAPEAPKYLTDAFQVKGAVDDVLQNYGARNLNTPVLTGTMARRAQEVREQVRRLIDEEVPELKQANEAYETYMSEVVEPMKDSVIGRLAGRSGSQDGIEAATSKLFTVFNKGTIPGSAPSDILTLEKAFRKAGTPEQFQDAAKSWLVTKLDDALKSKDNREPEAIASKLRQMWGNPRMADSSSKGLEDMLIGLARSQGLKDETEYLRGFHRFMEYVSDAARRPSSVSGSSSAELRDVAGEAATNRLGTFSIMTPIRQPALAWSTFLQNDALKAMDELLTSSSGIDTLIRLGKEQPYSQGSLTAMATFLGTNASVQSGGNPPALP